MKTFSAIWKSNHIFRAISDVIPSLYSLVIRSKVKITALVSTASEKVITILSEKYINSALNMVATKNIILGSKLDLTSKLDTAAIKKILISNSCNINSNVSMSNTLFTSIANSTIINSVCNAILSLIISCEKSTIKLQNSLIENVIKYESVKNTEYINSSVLMNSQKALVCSASINILSSSIDILKKVYLTINSSVSISTSLHLSSVKLRKLGDLDTLTLGELDSMTLGEVEILEEL